MSQTDDRSQSVAQPQDDDFFTRTFGALIMRTQAKRRANDQRFLKLVPAQPWSLAVPLTSTVVYGSGQRTFALNLYGRVLTFWNTDAGSYERGLEPINYTIPFLITLTDAGYRGIFVDNTFRGSVDIGVTDPQTMLFTFEGPARGVHDYYGRTLSEVVAQFTAQTGRMPLPPLWALGHHQSRYSYQTQEEVLAVAHEFRSRGIPCDAIYLDIHYMDDYKVFTWDHAAFPDLAGMASELHTLGIKLVAIVDPGVKVESGYCGYEEGVQEDVFLKLPDGTPAVGVVWPGETHHPDFSNARVRNWWAKQLQPLLAAGVDGLWNDMNEPLYFGMGEAISPPDYLVHNVDGQIAYHIERHNLYGHEMAMASQQALLQANPDKRPFNITRSGYAGTQAYASSWTGDNKSTWDDLKLSIAMNINMALSGQSFTGPDLGGFSADTSPELLVRWYQACVLFPFYRNHSAIDTIRQEPWQFGEPYTSIIRNAILLRYQLLPYLYTVAAACHYEGTPMMLPISALEANNSDVHNVDDAYLVGEHLLVAPILEPHAIRRMVYLPNGADWYSFDGKKHYTGGSYINVEAPLNIIPLFVRAGTALPLWPPIQTTQTLLVPKLRLYSGVGITRLYQDEGDGLGYQTGRYAWTTLQLDGHDLTYTVEGDPIWSRFTL
ncbi:TIM-barrel domain-containing protein [Aggregatilineales bacterium SYSU G02658]